MALKDELIGFFNDNVKEYETNLFVPEPDGYRPVTKEENTLVVVDQLISILDEYMGD